VVNLKDLHLAGHKSILMITKRISHPGIYSNGLRSFSIRSEDLNIMESASDGLDPSLVAFPAPRKWPSVFLKSVMGGELWPDVTFERFFDRNLFQMVYEKRIGDFSESNYFDTPAVEKPYDEKREATLRPGKSNDAFVDDLRQDESQLAKKEISS